MLPAMSTLLHCNIVDLHLWEPGIGMTASVLSYHGNGLLSLLQSVLFQAASTSLQDRG
jgi:hypothetical protein